MFNLNVGGIMSDGKEQVKQAVAKVKELLFEDPDVKLQWEDLTHVDGFSDFLKSVKIIAWFSKRIVLVVETVQKHYNLIPADKRIDVAAQVLDDLVKFKGWARMLEAFDEMLFKVIITMVVDQIDDRFGHMWPKVVGVVGKILG
jgi:hypothetical protein